MQTSSKWIQLGAFSKIEPLDFDFKRFLFESALNLEEMDGLALDSLFYSAKRVRISLDELRQLFRSLIDLIDNALEQVYTVNIYSSR